MRRLFSFFFSITFIIGSLAFYIGFRLIGVTDNNSSLGESSRVLFWLLLLIPTVLVWLVPTYYWRRENFGESRWELLFVWASSVSLGLMSFLFTLTVFRDLILLAAVLSNSRFTRLIASEKGGLAVALTSLIFLIVGVTKAMGKPFVKKVSIPIKNLPSALVGLTIAQISDLHVGATIRMGYVQKVVSILNSLGADIIAMTGDLVDGTVEQLRAQMEPIRSLKSTYGVYYITGNHEYYWGAPEWIREFRSLGVIPLLNSHKKIQIEDTELMVAGVVDYAAAHMGNGEGPDPEKALLPSEKPGTLKILLAHHPKIAERAAAAGYQLQLSGHTHGGQFFPWTYVAKFFHRFYKGLGRCDDMWVYVNQGTGSWGPPVRLGTSTEITLLTLEQQP